jgi:hypothetical protein
MTDDLKLPQVGELTLPRWQYWLARYNGVLGERDRRIEKLEAALRFIAGPSTVEFVDGTYEISETKMLSTYRRRAKRALEGNYDD